MRLLSKTKGRLKMWKNYTFLQRNFALKIYLVEIPLVCRRFYKSVDENPGKKHFQVLELFPQIQAESVKVGYKIIVVHNVILGNILQDVFSHRPL